MNICVNLRVHLSLGVCDSVCESMFISVCSVRCGATVQEKKTSVHFISRCVFVCMCEFVHVYMCVFACSACIMCGALLDISCLS